VLRPGTGCPQYRRGVQVIIIAGAAALLALSIHAIWSGLR
jgi:hypothetical protein